MFLPFCQWFEIWGNIQLARDRVANIKYEVTEALIKIVCLCGFKWQSIPSLQFCSCVSAQGLHQTRRGVLLSCPGSELWGVCCAGISWMCLVYPASCPCWLFDLQQFSLRDWLKILVLSFPLHIEKYLGSLTMFTHRTVTTVGVFAGGWRQQMIVTVFSSTQPLGISWHWPSSTRLVYK